VATYPVVDPVGPVEDHAVGSLTRTASVVVWTNSASDAGLGWGDCLEFSAVHVQYAYGERGRMLVPRDGDGTGEVDDAAQFERELRTCRW
jgi:hypothetical protein